MSIFSAFVLVGSVQGVLLSFALSKIKGRDLISNRYLVYFLFVVSITLLGRFFYADTQVTALKTKILFLGDCIIFLYGPLLYLWMSRLIGNKNGFEKRELLHFIPSLIFVVSILPILVSSPEHLGNVFMRYGMVYTVEEFLAILHNIVYILWAMSLMAKFEKSLKEEFSFKPQTIFYKTLIWVSLIAVMLWGVSYLLSKFSDGYSLGSVGYHTVWFIMSTTIFALGYYAIKSPEIYYPLKREKEEGASKKPIPDLESYIATIEEVIDSEKPYLDPKLKLADFSEMCGIQPHLMSRIINEHFHKNFFDFINALRTEEFIRRIDKDTLRQFTILQIAFEAGFNSKTTFNTSFKKNTGLTPKDYIKEHQ